jgi:hypothetical protein
MKKKLLSILTLLLTMVSFAQNDILLVTDNDLDLTDNTTFYNSLLTTSYTSVTLHEANAVGLPTSEQLNNYDLVIWFSGDDGYQLNFWSDDNELAGNTTITNYLDNGGKLWIIGSDLIYEKYGSAPAAFNAGDFMYDYAWLASYNMQTFVDDGGLGAPQADRTNEVSTEYPNTLTWIFSTLYYADAVTPRTDAISVYQFGPDSYPKSGETTMTFYENDTYSVMSTFFNPTSIDVSSTSFKTSAETPSNNLDYFIQASIDQIFASTLAVNNHNINDFTLKAYPNPTTDDFNIVVNNALLLNKNFEIYSLLGKVILKGKITDYTTKISTKNLSKGTYFLKVNNTTKKLIKY